MRLDEIELLNSIKEESNICSFRLIERNVLKGNKDRRERCKIRGKKKRSDCFVHVRGSYFRSRRNRYLGDTKCRQERARNLMSFLCLCGGIKTEAAEKKVEEKAEWPANGSTTAALVHKIESRKHRAEIRQFPLGYR